MGDRRGVHGAQPAAVHRQRSDRQILFLLVAIGDRSRRRTFTRARHRLADPAHRSHRSQAAAAVPVNGPSVRSVEARSGRRAKELEVEGADGSGSKVVDGPWQTRRRRPLRPPVRHRPIRPNSMRCSTRSARQRHGLAQRQREEAPQRAVEAAPQPLTRTAPARPRGRVRCFDHRPGFKRKVSPSHLAKRRGGHGVILAARNRSAGVAARRNRGRCCVRACASGTSRCRSSRSRRCAPVGLRRRRCLHRCRRRDRGRSASRRS